MAFEIFNHVDLSIFGGLDLEKLTTELVKRKVEITDIVTLDDTADTKKFIVEELGIDLDFDLLYPENRKEKILFSENGVSLNGYNYIVEFFQIDKDGDEYIWYSAYENLSNLEKEIKLIDIMLTI